MHDPKDAADDDFRSKYDLDHSNAKPNRFARQSKPVKLQSIRWTLLVVCIGLLMFGVKACTAPSELPLPTLIPPPTLEEQRALIAAIKAHPNPPLAIDALPVLGTDAKGLAVLLGEMEHNGSGLGGDYEIRLAPSEDPAHDVAILLIEIAGHPPRLVRRWIETKPGYAP